MKKDNLLVTVIIPVYNGERYIEACLYSVCNQTLREIEIICVNDGSTDSSLSLLQKIAQTDKRIRILEQKNKGLSATRNLGLAAAEGEYVLFLDCDDTLVPDALENLYGTASENRLDTLFFSARVVYETFGVKLTYYRKYNQYYRRTGSYPGVQGGPEMFRMLVENGDYRMSACLQLIRRQFLIENVIDFREGILHEDNLFTFRVILGAERVMVIPGQLYIRLLRKGSIMTGISRVRSSWGYFVCLREMIEQAGRGVYSPKVRTAVHHVIMLTQREAILPICGMGKEEVIECLLEKISPEEQLQYELLVLNGEWMQQQRKLRKRIIRVIKRRLEKEKVC